MKAKLAVTLAAGAVALGMAASHALSVSVPVPVRPDTAGPLGWSAVNTNCAGGPRTGSVSFSDGPQSMGEGSLKLTVGPNGNSLAQLRQSLLGGVRLHDITDVRYSTFVTDGTGGQAPELQLSVDVNGDSLRDDLLTFRPRQQGIITKNAWQTWNAGPDAGWISGLEGLIGLHEYADARPNARIVNAGGLGGLAVSLGCEGESSKGAVGYVDGLTFAFNVVDLDEQTLGAGLTFDFEPTLEVSV